MHAMFSVIMTIQCPYIPLFLEDVTYLWPCSVAVVGQSLDQNEIPTGASPLVQDSLTHGPSTPTSSLESTVYVRLGYTHALCLGQESAEFDVCGWVYSTAHHGRSDVIKQLSSHPTLLHVCDGLFFLDFRPLIVSS